MQFDSSLVLKAFHEGVTGASVRSLELEGATVSAARSALGFAGFQARREGMGAERSATGRRRWRTLDNRATEDSSDPKIVPVEFHLHPDGGMVRLFPFGDPQGRTVPAVTPSAIKSVVFAPIRWVIDPATGSGAFEMDLRFANEAFRVTDAGKTLPKSRRVVYGHAFDHARSFESFLLATETIAEYGVIRLRHDSSGER